MHYITGDYDDRTISWLHAGRGRGYDGSLEINLMQVAKTEFSAGEETKFFEVRAKPPFLRLQRKLSVIHLSVMFVGYIYNIAVCV